MFKRCYTSCCPSDRTLYRRIMRSRGEREEKRRKAQRKLNTKKQNQYEYFGTISDSNNGTMNNTMNNEVNGYSIKGMNIYLIQQKVKLPTIFKYLKLSIVKLCLRCPL